MGSIKQEQRQIAEWYAERFGIEAGEVLFLNDRDPYEPWFNKDALLAICRTSPKVREVGERFDQFCAQLKQVIHTARLVRDDNKVFEMSGVATIGEKLGGKAVDEHKLAAARALRSAMDGAGFNPLKPSTLVEASGGAVDQSGTRLNELKTIHILARRVGLIDGKDHSKYRKFIKERFGTATAGTLDQKQRASLISLLRSMERKEA